MIATFPSLSRIDMRVREDIARLAAPWRQYQQLSFAMLFAFDLGADAVAELNGNLVMKIEHPVSGAHAYSLCGSERLAESASTVLQRADQAMPYLHLVPCDVAEALGADGFRIERDYAASEYILELTPTFAAATKNGRGRNARRFSEVFLPTFEQLDLTASSVVEEIKDLTRLWCVDRFDIIDPEHAAPGGKELADVQALWRFLRIHDHVELEAWGVRTGGALVAFGIFEEATETTMLSLFAKSLRRCPGANDFLFLEAIRHFIGSGKRYLNIAEDLGIPTLRRYKQSWRPAGGAEKFTVHA